MRLLCILCVLMFGGCTTVQKWTDYIEGQVKEKVRVTANVQVIEVYRWTGDGWTKVVDTVPAGSYILPPLPELIGLKR